MGNQFLNTAKVAPSDLCWSVPVGVIDILLEGHCDEAMRVRCDCGLDKQRTHNN